MNAPPQDPSIGVDEWVAREAQRRSYSPGIDGVIEAVREKVNWWVILAVATALGAIYPLTGVNSGDLQVYFTALLLALLAVGLNIAVGWAGLLDLGYIAFFGFGAYGFALLSSNQLSTNGIHLQAWESLPIVMVGGAILGLVVGLPSRRLIGDYLAIVTLFFGEAFVEFTNNVATSKLGGPNGIVGLDQIRAFGTQISSVKGYVYLMLALLVVTIIVLHLLDTSRTGRAWRAVREDPLAASLMTVPVNRVKLMAFSFGAMIAALAGAVFAAEQSNVFPTNFDTSFLILIYAALILGGVGSMGGAVVGAVVLEFVYDKYLRVPHDASLIFYALILIAVVVKVRPWRRLAAVLGGTIVFGLVAHAVVSAISSSAVAGGPQSGGWLADVLRDWVIVPASHGNIPPGPGNVGFALLIAAVIALVQLRGLWRTILIGPTIYLAACVWEARLVVEPSVTRLILTGAILMVMMNSRPQGLLGTRRVEIV
jgi:branched-chain amino acid transport system permease protein